MDVFYDLQNLNNENGLPLDQLKYSKNKKKTFICKTLLVFIWSELWFLTLYVSLY